MSKNSFGAAAKLRAGGSEYTYYRLAALANKGLGSADRLPFSIRILLEAVLRNCDGYLVTEDDVKRVAAWDAKNPGANELPGGCSV